jgi:hypothetical protein
MIKAKNNDLVEFTRLVFTNINNTVFYLSYIHFNRAGVAANFAQLIYFHSIIRFAATTCKTLTAAILCIF